MDSQRSTPREYDDDIDQLCHAFANAFLSPAREGASRAKNLPIKSPPQPVGRQDYNTSKQGVTGGADPFSGSSRAQRTEASQSKTLRSPSTFSNIDPQSHTAGKEAINLSPDPLRNSSSTQGTAARQSLVIRLPLPQGMLGLQNGASNKFHDDNHPSQSQRPSRTGGEEACPRNTPPMTARAELLGPQNEISTSLTGDPGSTPFTTPSSAHHHQKEIQSRGVPVPHPRRRRPHNHLDVLGPNPYRIPSRGQREAVFKAAEKLRALQSCTTRSFFRLPAELRLIIYEYALISQSPITPRLDGVQKGESKEVPLDAAESLTQGKASSLALLQTCRLVDREARPVYYASNTFRITSAKDLFHFLQHLEPGLLDELRKLHIEGLTSYKPTFTKEFLETWRTEGLSDTLYQSLASSRSPSLDDNADISGHMLRQCRRLHRIRLSMDPREEMSYITWLRIMNGCHKTIVEFSKDDYWVLRSASEASTFEWSRVLMTALMDYDSYRALFPVLEKGQRRCIDVDFGIDREIKELV